MNFDLQKIADYIRPLNKPAMEEARRRMNALAKPIGSLGQLEELVIKLAGIQEVLLPEVAQKGVITFAGDHGIVSKGVSTVPSEVTGMMVDAMMKGGAAISILSKSAGARHILVDVGVATPYKEQGIIQSNIKKGTKDITIEPAMTEEEAYLSMKTGWDVFMKEKDKGLHLYGTGEMGIGNTTAATAVLCALTNLPPDLLTGAGTGLTQEQVSRKSALILEALEKHQPKSNDPIDVLRTVGGLEIGAIAGSILAAAATRTAVVVDGFISTAGAMLAIAIDPMVQDYLIFSHLSAEAGHKIILNAIGEKPYLDLGLRLGEGTGAALLFPLIESACQIQKNMLTLQDLGL